MKKLKDILKPGAMSEEEKKKRKIYIYIGCSVAFLLFLGFIIKGLPSLEELENPKPVLASKVFSVDGELIGQFYIENRIETHLDSIPKHLINALVATEDKRFYDHWGVDVERFGKAMVKNVLSLSLHEGASTITQQLAKNLYKLKSKNENVLDTGVRKIREWITAIQIEKTYTKDEIIEMYLNNSYFGRGAYGIQTAANVFFNKDVRKLNIQESSVLIALLKSSVNYDPIKKYENSLRRRNLVMQCMVESGYLDEDKYDRLKKTPINVHFHKIEINTTIAPHFMEYIRKQMEKIADKHGYDLYRDGLNIYTSIDSRMQIAANNAVESHLKEYQDMFHKSWNWSNKQSTLNTLVEKAIKNSTEYENASDDQEKLAVYKRMKNSKTFIDSVKKNEERIQVGFVAIDPSNGQIRAMVGGADPENRYGLNHATGIRRQPGSSFKPIVYTTAIENGLYPAYPILNQPINYNGWSPKNSDFSTGGYTTLRDGLKRSLNLITARLITEGHAPLDKVGEIAKKMGIKSNLNLVPSIALGTSEVSPLELTSAYATLANKGIYVTPISILSVEDKDGILIEKFYPEKIVEAVSIESAAMMTDMLKTVVDNGTGAGVRRYFHRPAAGKTGTTQDYGDAWFVGYTPQLVAGVWVGFDDNRIKFTGSYGQGARAAAPIWGKFMESAYNSTGMPLQYFDLPSNVIWVDYCSQSIYSGHPKSASRACPTIISDITRTGNIPPECGVHQGSSVPEF